MALTVAQMGQIAFDFANSEKKLSEDRLAQAEFHVARAKIYLKGRYTYDPDILDVELAENYLIEYAKLKLLGLNPHTNAGAIAMERAWKNSAAITQYRNHPDGYKDYPGKRKRIRDNTTKVWDPS